MKYLGKTECGILTGIASLYRCELLSLSVSYMCILTLDPAVTASSLVPLAGTCLHPPTETADSPISQPLPPWVWQGGVGGRRQDSRKRGEGGESLSQSGVWCCASVFPGLVGRMFFIDKSGDGVSEADQQRLDQRALRFADGNRSYKKKLSVAELVAAAVSAVVVVSLRE